MRTINLIPKPCELRLGNSSIDFKWYDRPGKARKIAYEYLHEPEIKLSEHEIRGINDLVSAARRCIDLDISLDVLFSQSIFPYPRPRFGGNCMPGDWSENTGDDLARTRWEENTCHDAFLVVYVIRRI